MGRDNRGVLDTWQTACLLHSSRRTDSTFIILVDVSIAAAIFYVIPKTTFLFALYNQNRNDNKKVLLHERKRHTIRWVASTRYAVPVGGTPPWNLTWMGGVPPPCPAPPILGSDLDRGYPLPPTWTWKGGTLPILTWEGGTPRPADVNRQTPVKTVPSLVPRTRAVKMTITLL